MIVLRNITVSRKDVFFSSYLCQGWIWTDSISTKAYLAALLCLVSCPWPTPGTHRLSVSSGHHLSNCISNFACLCHTALDKNSIKEQERVCFSSVWELSPSWWGCHGNRNEAAGHSLFTFGDQEEMDAGHSTHLLLFIQSCESMGWGHSCPE